MSEKGVLFGKVYLLFFSIYLSLQTFIPLSKVSCRYPSFQAITHFSSHPFLHSSNQLPIPRIHLSSHLPIHPPTHPSFHPSFFPPIHHPSFHPSFHSPILPFTCPSIYPPSHSSIYPSNLPILFHHPLSHPPFFLFTHLLILPSMYLPPPYIYPFMKYIQQPYLDTHHASQRILMNKTH